YLRRLWSTPAPAATPSATFCPHLLQNSESAASSAPQWPHAAESGDPHFRQKRASCALSVRHWRQGIASRTAYTTWVRAGARSPAGGGLDGWSLLELVHDEWSDRAGHVARIRVDDADSLEGCQRAVAVEVANGLRRELRRRAGGRTGVHRHVRVGI